MPRRCTPAFLRGGSAMPRGVHASAALRGLAGAGSHQHVERVLNILLERLQPLRAERPIHHLHDATSEVRNACWATKLYAVVMVRLHWQPSCRPPNNVFCHAMSEGRKPSGLQRDAQSRAEGVCNKHSAAHCRNRRVQRNVGVCSGGAPDGRSSW